MTRHLGHCVRRSLLIVLCTAMASSNGFAQTPSRSDNAASSRCEALQGVDFSGTLDAATSVTRGNWVASGDPKTGYCEVSGFVAPRIEFLLRLPSAHWNGKFIELGCGGPCGTLAHINGCDGPLRRGYACIVSDGGHKVDASEPMKWAYDNPQAAIEYFARASHVTALAGKSVLQAYYGRGPRKSYFMGCSAGGIQAMWLAQKFPWDFDGIVAGGPCFSLSKTWLNWLWANRALVGADGRPRLASADFATLHQAAVAACDRNDGIEDGVIDDPRACRFDPTTLACPGEKNDRCLTAEQVEAVMKVYGGPVTSRGEPIAAPLVVRGSELTWSQLFLGSATHPNPGYTYLKAWPYYSIFKGPFGSSWKPQDFDFDRDYKRLGAVEALEPMHHADLRRLKSTGAKLIVYTGWNDSIEGVHNTIEYYEMAERVVGSRAATQDFFRLFVVPGMNHCLGGEGAFAIDWLSHLEAWVESGQAPDRIVGAHIRTGDLDASTPAGIRELQRRSTYPLEEAHVAFTRPVYPYPIQAQYLGRGNWRDASSFAPRSDH